MPDSSRSALEQSAIDAYRDRFGQAPTALALAPGRVELLGNHTDYNGGLVLSAAIDRFTVVAGRPIRSPNRQLVFSPTFREDLEIPLDAPATVPPAGSWKRYVQGVSELFLGRLISESGHPFTGFGTGPFPLRAPFEAVILGDIPIGAGLSSSASLEAAFAFFLHQIDVPGPSTQLEADGVRLELARALQRVENLYVGVSCGLLDQFSVLMARAGQALFLDCSSEAFERVPLGEPAPAIIICDSRTSRRLADGMYNQRRAECESVLAHFQGLREKDLAGERAESEPGSSFERFWKRWIDRRDHAAEAQARRPPLSSLSRVRLSQLEQQWDRLDPVARRRARHVLTENERVERGVEALHRGDSVALGRLMSESHRSSRDDFENSSPALDALVEAAEESPGILGAKLSGAGWAGCTVNLVQAHLAGSFAESIRTGYERRTGSLLQFHVCHSASGAASFPIQT